jgi:hypothetical protein
MVLPRSSTSSASQLSVWSHDQLIAALVPHTIMDFGTTASTSIDSNIRTTTQLKSPCSSNDPQSLPPAERQSAP